MSTRTKRITPDGGPKAPKRKQPKTGLQLEFEEVSLTPTSLEEELRLCREKVTFLNDTFRQCQATLEKLREQHDRLREQNQKLQFQLRTTEEQQDIISLYEQELGI